MINKKILSTIGIVLVMVIANVTVGQTVYAAELSSKTTKINPRTVITKNNIDEVLEYVGIDPSTFIKTDVDNNSNVTTVGELQATMKTEKELDKKQPKTINIEQTKNVDLKNNIKPKISRMASSSKYLEHIVHVGTAFDVTFFLTGSYNNSGWTNASGFGASVDTDHLGVVYKVAPNPDLRATVTASSIYYSGYVTINKYIGVGNIGLAPIAYQGVQTKCTFNF